ncbi:hypothetical protein OZ666_01130 [Elizabethkingia sp. HX QKY]|uniref:hypothetical protein n=1 Tax=Elizabethkingia TaxID=308865 RepID=UPI002A2450F5|nr:hypothetical protein [Elizabethkingia sp. HX QKY]MDX8570264.1 hypothetical protein [Elizabethkingia sp. HX QKY]
MKLFKLIAPALIAILFSMSVKGQQKVTDFLSIPGPVQFDNASWRLNWSSHPNANYYKQEYLTPGEQTDKYKRMLMIDYIAGSYAVKDIAGIKLNELKKLKETNPIVQFQMYENNGEIILDFLLSANDNKGSVAIIERNIYRYRNITDSSGNPGVVLFGLSERGYAPDIEKFLTDLKSNIQTSLNAVAAFNIPQVNLKNK